MLETVRTLFARIATVDTAFLWGRAAMIVIGGLIVGRILGAVTERLLGGHLEQHRRLLRRLVFGVVLALFLAAALQQLGFKLGVLFGAAGILSVAIGFASQTSASNLISGVFLMAERPFTIGDIITVDGTTGVVISIDLLSAKLRTFDNNFVRIPNETLIKSKVTTLTKFPIRRIDLAVGVSYSTDLEHARQILLGLADANPLVLEEPEPLYLCLGFGDSAINLQFSVWVDKELFGQVRTQMYQAIKAEFDKQGIEIPFPQRTVHLPGGSRPAGLEDPR